jgi:signal transduction histidine kinase
MRSLHFRIVAAILIVGVVALAGVASYVGRTTLLVSFSALLKPQMRDGNAAKTQFSSIVRTAYSPQVIQTALIRLESAYGVRFLAVDVNSGMALASWGPIARGDVTMQHDGTIALMHAPGFTSITRWIGGRASPDAAHRGRWRLFVILPGTIDALAPVRRSILNSIWESAVIATAVAILVAILLGSYIVRPIRDLTHAAHAMSEGDTTRRVRNRTNDEIGQLAIAFNAMADAIERTERLRRQMITDVAHELRSPLTRMIVQLEAEKDGHVTHDEALAGVRDETERLRRIVDDLRDLSLADANELTIVCREVSLGRCIDDAVERMARNAERVNVSLERAVAPDLPPAIGDELRVAQILDNLLSNAVSYTPSGGRVVVGATATVQHIECFVQDSGDGIAREHLPFIFERFYRADPSRRRATGGSGLGLSIVKSLVEAQGGSIRAESRLGAGSRFAWTLPRSS